MSKTMIKPVLKTLAFSFLTLASAAVLQASEQRPATDRAADAASADPGRFGCATQSEIDLGWEELLAQIEERLDQREAEGLLVPGAIISAPFESFAPYRTDLPPAATAAKAVRRAPSATSGRG